MTSRYDRVTCKSGSGYDSGSGGVNSGSGSNNGGSGSNNCGSGNYSRSGMQDVRVDEGITGSGLRESGGVSVLRSSYSDGIVASGGKSFNGMTRQGSYIWSGVGEAD